MEEMKAEPLSEQELTSVARRVHYWIPTGEMPADNIADDRARLLAPIEKLKASVAHSNTTPTSAEVEELARIIYTAVHHGLKNIWSWDDSGLDDEHPGSRERFLMEAKAVLVAGYRKPALPDPEGAMEAAAKFANEHTWEMKFCSWQIEALAALITAREAAVREACAQYHDNEAAKFRVLANNQDMNGRTDALSRASCLGSAEAHDHYAAAIRAGGQSNG